ncbi:MAG: MFS transporter [Aeromicrobium sp.]|uniref:MFS transporter n=1 Tax=Aeromicrobium sp. TaxID=1871063 RepID=UPI0039E5F172
MDSVESPKLPALTLLSIVVVEFVALGSLTAPLLLGLALIVHRFDSTWTPEERLSLVMALGAASAMVFNALFGALSDRTRHRAGGVRATWVVGGVIGGAPTVLLLAQASTMWQLALLWCLAQGAFNSTFAGLYGVIADQTPETDRARVSGWFGGAAVLSVVAALGVATFLPKDPGTVMAPMAVAAIPVTLLAYLHLRRLPRPSEPRARVSTRAMLREVVGQRQFWWVWSQRLLVQLAYGLVIAYGLFFLIRRVGLDEERASTWVAATAALAAVASAVAAVVTGRLVGRHGNYGWPIVIAIGVIVAGTAFKLVGTSLTAFVIATVAVGVGVGCYYAVDLALVLRTVPGERAGQFLGLFNIARTLPQSLAPALGPLFLAIGSGDVIGDGSQNYFALFAFGMAVAVASLLPLRRITVLRRDAVETSA